MNDLPEMTALNETIVVPREYSDTIVPRGTYILTVDDHHFKGKTGPIMTDPSRVNGWEESEIEDAIKARDTLQSSTRRNTKIAVIRRSGLATDSPPLV